jgi:sulfur relay (sulfurtransferase) DsrF/TusC family protein
MAAGLLAVGDIDDCKVLLLKDAVYFLNKNLSPEVLKVDTFENVIRLIELSDLQIYVHDEALENAGMDHNDLILQSQIKFVNFKEISQLILKADMSFKY